MGCSSSCWPLRSSRKTKALSTSVAVSITSPHDQLSNKICAPEQKSKQAAAIHILCNDVTYVADPDSDKFSKDEQRLLKSQWKILNIDPVLNGIAVVLNIFARAPDIKAIFAGRLTSSDSSGKVSENDVMESAFFRGHAGRLMTAITVVIDNLNDLDFVVTPTLTRLGRKHVNVDGFKEEQMNAFKDAIIEVWRSKLGGSCQADNSGNGNGGSARPGGLCGPSNETVATRLWDDRSEAAWSKVLALITSKVYNGYLEAFREQEKRNQATQPRVTGHDEDTPQSVESP